MGRRAFIGINTVGELNELYHGNRYLWGIIMQTVLQITVKYIQSSLNCSNRDGLFTMADSNSFLSPFEILPISPENKYLRKFSYFIMKLYVVCTHKNCLIEVILMSTLNIPLLFRRLKRPLNYRHLLADLAPSRSGPLLLT